MYKKAQITDCLYQIVGWRQTEHPDLEQLSPSLLESSTGRFFQDEHPLINIEYIDQCFKNYSSFVYPVYAPGTTYMKGTRVTFNAIVYESLVSANIGNQPDVSPNEWEAVNELSKKLEWLTKSSLDDVISNMFINKKLHEATKSIFENVQIFDGVGNIQDKEIKRGRFVGIAIELYDHQHLSIILESIGLQLSAANGNLDIYVYHTSSQDPVNVFQFNHTLENRFEWFDAEKLELKQFDPALDAGGFWMIGYYEDDLVGQAIIKDYDFYLSPGCSTCNNNYYYWEKWSRFAKYFPISVDSSDLAGILPSDPGGAKLFDLNDINRNYYNNNFGINIDLTAKCDVSDLICKQSTLFADAIGKQVTLRVLKELAFNTRNNNVSKEVSNHALYELNIKENPSGFMTDYNRSMKAITFDMSDMNSACLPCDKKFGTRSSKS